MTRYLGWMLAALTLCLCGCSASTDALPEDAQARQLPLISDEIHSHGTDGFFFLPPVVEQAPRFSGEFQARLEPVVRIDRVSATGATLNTVATLDASSSRGAERVRRHPRRQFYIARWNTGRYALNAAFNYRARVLVEGRELGFADVDVVSTSNELRRVDRAKFVPVKKGDTLPIKFRIEGQAVDADGDGVLDGDDNCPSVANPLASLRDDPYPTRRTPSGCDHERDDCDPQELDCLPKSKAEQLDSDNDGIGDACECLTVTCTAPDECHTATTCKSETGACVGAAALPDGDGDGTCDVVDECPLDPSKTEAGACGCGTPAPGACNCETESTDADGDSTPDCRDECTLDASKTSQGTCGCDVPDEDTDGDGIADCVDGCPSDALKLEPGVCGCELADADTDHDGTPDCRDECATDAHKTSAGACGCGTRDTDTDGDESPDCADGCIVDALKTAPGICGCGVADADTDHDGTANCHDECPVDSSKNAPGSCGCGAPDVDTDHDGSLDCSDACPGNASKIDGAGTCGCDTPDSDTDGDGTLDCRDECTLDPHKAAPGACGCGAPDDNRDGDVVADCLDGCPEDANKAAGGVCGCGLSDVDADSDGTADCFDACAGDPAKTEPGLCGCGSLDEDTDADGTYDCEDGCALDAAKTAAGHCGCEQSETDTDADATADCVDACPTDAAKTSPGACGCGVSDEDTDADGAPNCADACPNDVAKLAPAVCGCDEPDADDDADGLVDCEEDPCPDDPENDADGDGVCAGAGDCDDGSPAAFPGATETCNSVDDDCDGALSAAEMDADSDGASACNGDCNDADGSVYPGAPEQCGQDKNCDGAAPSCDDGNACTTDVCSTGACEHAAVGCDDGNACTADHCDPARGCTYDPLLNGTACSDHDACNGVEVCAAGVCSAGSPPSIDDGDACTVDRCAPSQGVVHEPIASPACSGESPIPALVLPPEFSPPTAEPTARVGDVELLDPDGVLPGGFTMTESTDAFGTGVEDEIAAVRLEPSGALAGTVYLRVPLVADAPTDALVALWTRRSYASKFSVQSLGRIFGSSAIVPLQHFSDQRVALTPLSAAPVGSTRRPISFPPEYDNSTHYLSDRALAATSVSHSGVASLRLGVNSELRFRQEEGAVDDFDGWSLEFAAPRSDSGPIDPFPAGAGSRDGTVKVDDRMGVLQTPTGPVALTERCGSGDILRASARVSLDGRSVSWVASESPAAQPLLYPDESGNTLVEWFASGSPSVIQTLCRMDIATEIVESCTLETDGRGFFLSTHPGGSMSADGRTLVFQTEGALAPDDANAVMDVYAATLDGEAGGCPVELIGRDASGEPYPSGTALVGGTRAVSAKGRFVGFVVFGEEWTPSRCYPGGDGCRYEDSVLLVRDRARPETRAVGVSGYSGPATSWSLSDSGRYVAHRDVGETIYAPRFSNGLYGDYLFGSGATDRGLISNVVDGPSTEVWPHPLRYQSFAGCEALSFARPYWTTSDYDWCYALRGPYGLSLSGDAKLVTFLAGDGGPFGPEGTLLPELAYQERVSTPVGPAPPVQVPTGVQELEPFAVRVGSVARATPVLLQLRGPDNDAYEFPLQYADDGWATVNVPGIAGGLWGMTVVVDADADLPTLESRPLGPLEVAAHRPTLASDLSDLFEYVPTAIDLQNLRTEEPGNRVDIVDTRGLGEVLITTIPLVQARSTSFLFPSVPEGSYAARIYVSVLHKARLRLEIPLEVRLGFEDLGEGHGQSVSSDGTRVASCRDGNLVVHDRPTRQERTFDVTCHETYVIDDGTDALVAGDEAVSRVSLTTGVVLQSFRVPTVPGVHAYPSFGSIPISEDGRLWTFEARVVPPKSEHCQENDIHAYLFDSSSYEVVRLLRGDEPSVVSGGGQLLYGVPLEEYYSCRSDEECPDYLVGGGCDRYNGRCIFDQPRSTPGYYSPECLYSVDNPIPTGRAVYPGSLIPNDFDGHTAVALMDTNDLLARCAGSNNYECRIPNRILRGFPDIGLGQPEFFVQAAEPGGNLLFVQVNSDRQSASWVVRRADGSLSFVAPFADYRTRFPEGTLLGASAWIVDASNTQVQHFAAAGRPGDMVVRSSAGDVWALGVRNLRVSTDGRILSFSARWSEGRTDTRGDAAFSVLGTPPPLSTQDNVYLVPATP